MITRRGVNMYTARRTLIILHMILFAMCATAFANKVRKNATDSVLLSAIYRDWDSVAVDAGIRTDSEFISQSDWREVVRYETEIMRRSKSYTEMELQVEHLAAHAKYVIRVSERYLAEFHTFPDTVEERGDTLLPI